MTTQSTFDYVPDESEKKHEKPIKPVGAHKPTAAESVKAHIAESDTALAVIEIKRDTALTVFTAEKGLDPYLAELEARARASIVGADETTIAGQDIIRSVAYSISKSKKPIENLAADLKKDAYALVDKVNLERDRGIKCLDDLQKELRRPLTEYEEKEKARIAAHKQRLEVLAALPVFVDEPTSEAVRQRINNLTDFNDIEWQEYTESAKSVRKTVEDQLADMLVKIKKAEDDSAELARLRKEQAEREQKERDEKIAADAAEAARKEAERIAAEEKAAIEKKAAEERAAKQKVIDDQAAALAKAEQDKKDAAEAKRVADEKAAADAKALAEKVEADKKEAQAKAERDKAAALKKQQDDAAAAQKVIDDAAAKRAADTAHKSKINNAAKDAIQAIMDNEKFGDDLAVEIVKAIAQGTIPNVTITY